MTALDRVLKLLDIPPAEPDTGRGHLDLLGETSRRHDTIAQRLMRSGPAGFTAVRRRSYDALAMRGTITSL